jgi:hypothetical protein
MPKRACGRYSGEFKNPTCKNRHMGTRLGRTLEPAGMPALLRLLVTAPKRGDIGGFTV